MIGYIQGKKMDDCFFCKLIKKNTDPTIIVENDYAIVLANNVFREGHCTVLLKKHKISISELDINEFNGVFTLIKMTSNALEKKFNSEKTYLLTIGDMEEHLHFHLIPKHKNLCSMGVYCFGKLAEAEGQRNPTKEEQISLKNEIQKIL